MPNWQNITLESAIHERFISAIHYPKQGKTRLDEKYV
ncbi:Uncharacterised protein [Yersinia enterocolitica]|uniref:Uncharacterized protein n=1 Tax=Yersinia enterocolitica TaxID=630 RepID=A0A0E1NGX1_YEREN|nr:hypothetical protein CH48_2437 [Yersinia enterocolitica]VEF81496.1 Uncharacterised protein [Yersinia enterocolitica subsp. palearctica]CFQ12802.1 Uncharacterised protein [Yersinia enterocolitica]CFQ52876.1 Uncharacterised protein [Yersinia enterocolitica]CFV24874.1 Uncharacterised protein [Yersinia enterocolitica]